MSTESVVQEVEDRRTVVMYKVLQDLQEAHYNRLYALTRSSRVRFQMKCCNMVAALAASAALAGLFSSAGGMWLFVWKGLTGVAAVLAAVGPVLGWDAYAAQMEKSAMGHSMLADRFRVLLSDLRLSPLDDSHEARLRDLYELRNAMSSLDEAPDEATQAQCWRKTLEQIPSEGAWDRI